MSGGGRKKVSEEFETELNRWIHEMRQKHNRVSRKTIQLKARELYRHSRMEASLLWPVRYGSCLEVMGNANCAVAYHIFVN